MSDHRTTASTSRTARKAKRFPHDYANWHAHLASPSSPLRCGRSGIASDHPPRHSDPAGCRGQRRAADGVI